MNEKQTEKSGYDIILLFTVLCLVSIGLLAVYSSSCYVAERDYGDSLYFLKRQGIFFFLGLLGMIIVKNVPIIQSKTFIYLSLLISVFLLMLLFIPGVGYKAKGAYRWFRLWGGISVQPSELIKIFLAIYMAYSMSKKTSDMSEFFKGLIPHIIIIGLFIVLIAMQPDLGTAAILGFWLLILLFIGGVKIRHLLAFIIPGILGLWYAIKTSAFRMDRWHAYLDPWKDPTDKGYHITHSFMAFGSGGLIGSGIGSSIQKMFFLPEAHTDFILSVIGEETGLLGITVVVVLFGIFIYRGIRISLNAPDLFSSYLALSITTLIGLQVFINMAVVTGLLPTKGLALPFISYGGSSLICNMMSVGILLNISSRT